MTATRNTILDNPQLSDTIRYLGAGWVCVACGLPIEPRAAYAMIFSGSPASPAVFAVAHHDPPPGVEYAYDDNEWTVRPCARTLERVHHQLLDAAGVLRYATGADGPVLWQAGRPAELGRPPALRDLASGAHPGFVLLATGRWAQASYHAGDYQPLRLEYPLRPGAGPAVEPAQVDVQPPALFRPGGPWTLPGDKAVYDDGGPRPGQLEPGSDGGGFRWFLHGDPMHAGEALDVYLPGAGWTPARVETVGSSTRRVALVGSSQAATVPQANVHVALAGGSEVAIPAAGLDVRPPA